MAWLCWKRGINREASTNTVGKYTDKGTDTIHQKKNIYTIH